MTKEELLELCDKVTPVSLKEATEIGKQYGATKENVMTLRKLLGFSKQVGYKFDEETKKKWAKMFTSGISANSIAKKYKTSSNTIYHAIRKYGVDTEDKRHYSIFQEKRIIDCVKKDMTSKDIAALIGRSEEAIACKISKMTRAGKINVRRTSGKGKKHQIAA